MKYTASLLSLLIMIVFLLGCSLLEEDVVDSSGLEKVQRIDISSAENPEEVLYVIDHPDEVKSFVKGLFVHKWIISEVPARHHSKQYIYSLYQGETVTLGDTFSTINGAGVIAVITSYNGSPYVQFEKNKHSLTFKIPKEAAGNLSKLIK
ncbi:hypothetical protein GJU40_17760 [Bacillus lacus]|uniref:Lipoprotein n=1 Tax=Metabacillus lacus TaxID=1983721 RepID=A0A7X2J2B6_9BACI|nr:hypothetical protein [Metabacillus lacus]MRX73979.1 hypothetical protein [Metabacillus lacus]